MQRLEVVVLVDTMRLKKLRCSMGYFTAASFARALGMAKANYNNRECGRVPFSASEVVQVCNLLEIPIEEGISFLT